MTEMQRRGFWEILAVEEGSCLVEALKDFFLMACKSPMVRYRSGTIEKICGGNGGAFE